MWSSHKSTKSVWRCPAKFSSLVIKAKLNCHHGQLAVNAYILFDIAGLGVVGVLCSFKTCNLIIQTTLFHSISFTYRLKTQSLVSLFQNVNLHSTKNLNFTATLYITYFRMRYFNTTLKLDKETNWDYSIVSLREVRLSCILHTQGGHQMTIGWKENSIFLDGELVYFFFFHRMWKNLTAFTLDIVFSVSVLSHIYPSNELTGTQIPDCDTCSLQRKNSADIVLLHLMWNPPPSKILQIQTTYYRPHYNAQIQYGCDKIIYIVNMAGARI